MSFHAPESPAGAPSLISRLKRPILAVWIGAFLVMTGFAAWFAGSMAERPYAGFLLQPPGYVSPFQIAPLAPGALLALDQVWRIDGRVLSSPRELLERARAVPVGTPLAIEGRRLGQPIFTHVTTRRLSWEALGRSFVAFLLVAWALAAIGVVAFWLRPELAAARALALLMGSMAITILWYFDYNTTCLGGRWFLSAYPLVGAAFWLLALRFPEPLAIAIRWRWLAALPWGVAVLLEAAIQAAFTLDGPAVADPGRYGLMFGLMLAMNVWSGLGMLGLIGALTARSLLAARASLSRHQSVAALAGAGFGMLPFVAWVVAFNSGRVPWLPLAVSLDCMLLFPLAIAYAIVRAKLFDIQLVVRNGVLYFSLSAVLSGIYVLAATCLRLLGWGPLEAHGPGNDLVATAVVVAFFAPVRDRLQLAIDRRLFRASYDAQLALEEASQSMITLLDLDAIVGRMLDTVEATLQITAGAVLLRAEAASAYLPYARCGELHFPALAFDSPLVAEIQATQEILSRVTLPIQKRHRVSGNLEALTAELVVPLCFEGRLLGLLIMGAKRSETHFTDQDLRLLKTLGNQSAMALENALAYRKIQQFNQELESKVAERTTELARAYEELRGAQSMLVHNEKMAALGQLVAGVAHELNNPLSFVYSSVSILRRDTRDLVRLLEAYAAGAAPEVIAALREEIDADELPDGLKMILESSMQGAERMKAIVENLRKFSRLDEFDHGDVDLAESIETTLTLVRPNFSERVNFHLALADSPSISGSASHLNQVIMNLLVNACQAIEQTGDVWISLHPTADAVSLELTDNGRGMAPEVLARVFEPFFTTKAVGDGTGLGLSICHGIIEKHGGRIEAESRPGQGSTFRLVLPLAQPTTSEPHANHFSR